jgi:hypothetical protein
MPLLKKLEKLKGTLNQYKIVIFSLYNDIQLSSLGICIVSWMYTNFLEEKLWLWAVSLEV